MGKVAILGAGNGGCAAAVDLSLKGHEVAIFDLFPNMLTIIKEQGGIKYTGAIGEGFCKLSMVSSDIEEVIKDASLIMLNVPGPGHEAYAKALGPYLKKNDLVLMNPGHTGGALHFFKVLKDLGVPQPIKVCETNTLSYISRIVEPGKVKISSYDKSVLLSVVPGRFLEEAAERVNRFFPAMIPVESVFITSLSNINAICHPPGMILNAGWLENTSGNFRFYFDGITPAIGRVIDELDKERLAVGKALGIKLMNFSELFYSVGSTSKEAAEANSAYIACQDSEPNKFIKMPEKLEHRYMHEDINSGILPISYLGKLAGVSTPVIDSLIDLACILMGRNYWREGLDLEKMGLKGLNLEQAQKLIYEGIA
jgi:opine dehydrogenase